MPITRLNGLSFIDLPSSVRPSYSQMRHHVRGLFDVVDGDFEVPLLIKRRVLDSTDEYVRSNASHMIDQLRLKKEIFSWQQEVTDIVLRRSNSHTVTHAQRAKYVQDFWISSVLLQQGNDDFNVLVL